jgi:hypothetical protein
MASDDAEIIQLMKEDRRSDGNYNVVRGMEGDKKKAADSIAIQSSTGKDSQQTYGNYDVESKKVKSELAQEIVEKDNRLLKYIENDPLAATVSKDDWGNLATFTDTARQLAERANPIISAIKGIRNLHDAIYPGDSSYFMRGFVTGLTKENPELAAEFVEGMGYHMPEAFRPMMFTGSKAIRDFAATIKPEGYEPLSKEMFEVKGFGDAAAWAAEKFGGGIASLIPGVVAGGAGAAAGFGTAGPPGALVGGVVGAGSVSYAMGYGEVFKALKDEGVDPAFAANVSAGAAVLIGGLDMASFGSIAGKVIAPAATKELSKYVAVRIAKEFAKGATKEGLTESMQEIVKDAAVSWAADKKFGTPEQIKGWVESGVVGGMVGGPIQGAGGLRGPVNKDLQDFRKSVDQAQKTIDSTEPWVMSGEKPPVGVDPIVDHLIGIDSEERLKILDAVIENRDKTETKELSAEKWQDLSDITFEKQQIEVRWDAIKAIYGDKIPEPGDKLLGDIPDIAVKIANAAVTGESIKVKLSDWVGKVDSELHKLLHDDLSFPDGMSINEVKTKPKLEDISEIAETEVPGLSDELDKPYSLSKLEDNRYHILDENGDIAAGVRVVENEGGKNLHVHFETGQIDVAGLRPLMKQLREEYPEAETLTSPKMPGVEALRRALQGSNITVGMPFRIKESTVDVVRRSGGLEPLFDLPREGPRAVRLVRDKRIPIAKGDINFTITDELGNPIGEVTGATRQKGKDYYIDWIGAPLDDREVGGNLVNKLGPRLIRGLFRELKRELPGVQTVTGFRVTGTRGTYSQSEVVTINLAKLMEELEKAPAGWEGVEGGVGPEHDKMVDMTQGWTTFNEHSKLIAQRSREWTPQELALESKITKLLNKIVPQEVRHYGAEDIRLGSGQRRISGVMQPFHDRRPLILWALPDKEGFTAPHPEGTARHEAVHFLRQYGYIREDEWETLEKHVEDNDLIKKHGIDTRYWYADKELQTEEAIAEEFRTWEGRGSDPEHWGAKVLQRIREILDAIKSAYREYLGREPTVDDIFRDIDIGRTGARTPGEGPLGKGFGQAPPLRTVNIQPSAMEQLVPPVEPQGVPTFEPGALMDKARYAKYQKLINERNNEDAKRELDKAQAEIRRKEKPEWKIKEAEMKTEVTKEIANRPDWKVSQFFRNGMFFGMDTKYRPKIDPKYLTPEQQAGLPDGFMRKGGMDPDALAGSFGYTTGGALVDRMVEFERTKGKLGPKEFFDEMVKQETNRRMELKYGDLQENILKEAYNHVVSLTQWDLLNEEMATLAVRAGLSITKTDIKADQSLRFNGEVASEVSMRGYFREMYRAGKSAELAFLKGDWAEAFRQKQSQVNLFALAEHAKKFEKVENQIDQVTKQFNKRDIDVKYMPPEFTEWIHSILFQIGRPPKRLQPELESMIQLRPYKTLADFVEYKNQFPEGWSENEVEVNPTLVIADFLLDPSWSKNFDSLTVGEVRAINSSLQSLKKIGRMEGKSNLTSEQERIEDVIGKLDKQLSKRGEKKQLPPGQKPGILTVTHLGLLQPEALWDRLDEGNQRGIFSRYFGIPLARAANHYSALQQEYAKLLVAADKKYGLKGREMKRKVDNDVFYEPAYMEKDEDGKPIVPVNGTQWIATTKESVRAVILNWGNKSNRERLVQGYHTTEEKVEAWLDKVATKEDWLWAQEIKKIYDKIQAESDEMTFRQSGTLIEKLPTPSFQNMHGTWEGYYYPIIYDRSRDGGPKPSAEKSPPVKSLTYNGWERKRTGSAGPLDLSLQQMESFISRRLKDNAMREPLAEVHKIWFNKSFKASMAKYYGAHYNDMLKGLYEDLTGQTGYSSGTMNAGARFADGVRQQTISTLIGYNPGTVLKHGISALAQSWKEAGILKPDFYKATVDIFRRDQASMERNWSWISNGGMVGNLDWKGSTEIQNRHKHWAETIGGAGDIKMGKMNARETMAFYGSYPVAWADLISSKILWKARYDRVMRENVLNMPIEEAHIIAEEMADKAVRRTHGSTAITSRPAFMRSTNPFATNLTSLYGFFNHVYNRFYKMSWQAKDLGQGTVRGEIAPKEFMKGASDLTSDFMMYIVVPSLVEGYVAEAALTGDWDDKGWGEFIAHSMIHTISASVPLVRDVVHAVTSGHDPAAGLLGASYKGITDFTRQIGKEEIDPGKAIQAANTLLGVMFGLSSTQLGRWQKFVYNYTTGQEDPQTMGDWYRVFRTGQSEPRKGH